MKSNKRGNNQNQKQLLIAIFKEEDPFLELTVATPLDEQEDLHNPYYTVLQRYPMSSQTVDNDNGYTLRI